MVKQVMSVGSIPMKCLGFSFQKGRARHVALNRDDDISFIESSSFLVDSKLPLPNLMERYYSAFHETIVHHKPELVACRLDFDINTIDGATCRVMPSAILSYISCIKEIPFIYFTASALRSPGPFGLPAKTNLSSAVDEKFGNHPPYWDDLQRAAVLVAWRALLEHPR